MPILKNAQKALRQDRRRAVTNGRVRSKVKTSLDALKKSPSADLLSVAFSALDRAAKNKIIHKNKAARLKARASRLVK